MNQPTQNQLISRENPHTQAVAISWLVNSLYTKLDDRTRTADSFETCIQWMIDYESYPFDSILQSLKAGMKKHFQEHNDDVLKGMIKELLEEYYDRKIAS